MKINKFALLVLGAFLINTLPANEMEEITVSSALISKAASELADPIHIVSGDDLVTEATQSLGESLDDLLGVSSSDYGSAVGQPIEGLHLCCIQMEQLAALLMLLITL